MVKRSPARTTAQFHYFQYQVRYYLICRQLNHISSHFSFRTSTNKRTKRSTEDFLLYMTEKWRSAIDAEKSVGIIAFKKAFDTVSHPDLLKKLGACGISGQFHQYLESYLKNGERVDFGVLQGFLLDSPWWSMPPCSFDGLWWFTSLLQFGWLDDMLLVNFNLLVKKIQELLPLPISFLWCITAGSQPS